MVASAGIFPRDVTGVVKRSGQSYSERDGGIADEWADLVANPVSGNLDPVSGFAFVATPSTCIAWNYQKV